MATYYTLVQHTGYTVGGNYQFRHAVELQGITAREAKAAIAAGGLVFESYTDAAKAEMDINYPDPSYTGLIPHARGTFDFARSGSHLQRLYIPAHSDREDVVGFVSEVAA